LVHLHTFRQLQPFARCFNNIIPIIDYSPMTIDGMQRSSGHHSVTGPVILIALSLVAIAISYLAVGHIGPTYSSNVMTQQQARLRHQYGLPSEPIITNPKILQTPPSLRDISNNTQSRNSE
jgi:hypothetical protein